MAQSTDDRGNNSRALHNLIRSPDGIVVPVMDLGNIFAWCNEIEAKALADVSPAVIAAVGRPSAPVFPPLLAAVREYWATQSGDAIGYGALSGSVDDRARMAAALAKVYGVAVPVESVVFTVGGHHAIAATMAAYRQLHLHSSAPDKFVVSALPFYPAHCGV